MIRSANSWFVREVRSKSFVIIMKARFGVKKDVILTFAKKVARRSLRRD